jgi:hypothetical protein
MMMKKGGIGNAHTSCGNHISKNKYSIELKGGLVK